MKRRIELGILWCGIGILFFWFIFQWKELNQFSNQAGLRYEENGLTAQQIDNYNKKQRQKAEKNGEEAVRWAEITAWERKTEQSVSQKETGQQTTGSVLTVYGNMARVLPFSMKYGGFTYNEDAEGCIISSGLAWKLFGAEDVVGVTLQYKEKSFTVRGVADTKEPLLALYQQEKQKVMPYVEIWTEGEPPAAQLSQISSGLGLFGEGYSFAGSFYVSLARIVLSLPFWMVFVWLCRCFSQWCKRLEERQKKLWHLAGKIFLLTGIVIGLRFSISFTGDLVPVQWSDFGFWGEKWKEIVEGIQGRSRFPGIYWEQEVMGRVGRIAGGVLVNLVLLANLGSIHKRKQKKFHF